MGVVTFMTFYYVYTVQMNLGEVTSLHTPQTDYQSCSSSNMAEQSETAITSQPRSRRKEIEQFVRDLDPIQVQGKQVLS